MHRFLAVLLAGAASIGPAMADTVFTDNTFNLGNYTSTVPFSTDGIASLAATSCLTCGFGGSAGLQTVATFNNTAAAIVGQTFLNNGFTYNPLTQGTITTIDVSVEKDIFTDLTGTGFGNTFRITLKQGGVYYEDPIASATFTGPNDANTPGYGLISATGLTAASFGAFDPATNVIDFTSHPDFAGGAITFGLTQNSGTTGTGTITANYDNLNIDLHTADVPEPASLALLGLGLVSLGAIRRRVRR